MGVANKVQLDSGLSVKLKDAAQVCGSRSVPVGSHVGNGILWATLMQAARLDPTETIAV